VPFSANVEHARYLRLTGDLTWESASTLRRLLLGDEHIVVDCAELTSADDDAVALLGEIHEELAEMGQQLILTGLHGGTRRRAQLHGYSHFM
jgi:anti-anti-sigma regulatory factor